MDGDRLEMECWKLGSAVQGVPAVDQDNLDRATFHHVVVLLEIGGFG